MENAVYKTVKIYLTISPGSKFNKAYYSALNWLQVTFYSAYISYS